MSLTTICYVTDFGIVHLTDDDALLTRGVKFTKRGDVDKRQKHLKEKNNALCSLEARLGVSRAQLAQIRRTGD